MPSPAVSDEVLMRVSSDVNAATAAEFNTYMKRYPQLYRSMAARVQQYMTHPAPVILDVGTGTGLLSLELRRMYPMATLFCLDPLRSMLRLAEENTREASVEPLSLLTRRLRSAPHPVCRGGCGRLAVQPAVLDPADREFPGDPSGAEARRGRHPGGVEQGLSEMAVIRTSGS